MFSVRVLKGSGEDGFFCGFELLCVATWAGLWFQKLVSKIGSILGFIILGAREVSLRH